MKIIQNIFASLALVAYFALETDAQSISQQISSVLTAQIDGSNQVSDPLFMTESNSVYVLDPSGRTITRQFGNYPNIDLNLPTIPNSGSKQLQFQSSVTPVSVSNTVYLFGRVQMQGGRLSHHILAYNLNGTMQWVTSNVNATVKLLYACKDPASVFAIIEPTTCSQGSSCRVQVVKVMQPDASVSSVIVPSVWSNYTTAFEPSSCSIIIHSGLTAKITISASLEVTSTTLNERNSYKQIIGLTSSGIPLYLSPLFTTRRLICFESSSTCQDWKTDSQCSTYSYITQPSPHTFLVVGCDSFFLYNASSSLTTLSRDGIPWCYFNPYNLTSFFCEDAVDVYFYKNDPVPSFRAASSAGSISGGVPGSSGSVSGAPSSTSPASPQPSQDPAASPAPGSNNNILNLSNGVSASPSGAPSSNLKTTGSVTAAAGMSSNFFVNAFSPSMIPYVGLGVGIAAVLGLIMFATAKVASRGSKNTGLGKTEYTNSSSGGGGHTGATRIVAEDTMMNQSIDVQTNMSSKTENLI